MDTIDQETKDIFNQSTITENKVILPNIQLARPLYLKVNKHLDNCGGKWKRNEKAHVFANGTDKLKQSLEIGKTISEKKEYHAFYTPGFMSEQLMGFAQIMADDVVLEPSAGNGSLIENIILHTTNIVAVELNENAFNDLSKKFPNIELHNEDFLKFKSDKRFDKVVMNPPFNGNAWVKHIKHAITMLKDDGEIFAIIPNNLRSDYFKKHVLSICESEILGQFDDSFEGTKISTLMIKLTNE